MLLNDGTEQCSLSWVHCLVMNCNYDRKRSHSSVSVCKTDFIRNKFEPRGFTSSCIGWRDLYTNILTQYVAQQSAVFIIYKYCLRFGEHWQLYIFYTFYKWDTQATMHYQCAASESLAWFGVSKAVIEMKATHSWLFSYCDQHHYCSCCYTIILVY